jgi:hypothetical protein
VSAPGQFGGLNAGDVYVEAAARIDDQSFARWDAVYAKAASKPDIEVEARVDVDEASIRHAERSLDRVDKAVDTVDKRFRAAAGRGGGLDKFNLNLGVMSGRVGNILRVLAIFSPAVVALAGSLVSLAGSAGQAALGVGALGTAAGVAGATTIPLLIGVVTRLKDVTEVLKAREDARVDAQIAADKSLKDLNATQARAIIQIREMTVQERELVRELERGRDAFDKMIGPGREQVFDGISDSLRILSPRIGRFRDEFRDLGDAIADAMAGGAGAVATGRQGDQLEHLLARTDELAEDVARSLGAVGEIALNVAVRSLPELEDGLDGIADSLERIAEGSDSDEFADQLDEWIRSTRTWARLIGSTGDLLATVLGGGATEGDKLARQLDRVVSRWDRFLESAEGQRRMRSFFRDTRELLGDMWDFIKGFADGVRDTFVFFEPFVHLVGRLATHVLGIDRGKDGIEKIGAVFGTLAILKLTGVTRLVGMLLKLGTGGAGIAGIVGSLTGLDKTGPGSKALDFFKGRGSSPTNPLFVADVTGGLPGGGGTPTGGPVGAPGKAGRLGRIGSAIGRGARAVLPRAAGAVGGYLAFAEFVNAFTPDVDELTEKLDDLIEGPRDSPRAKVMRDLARDLERALKAGDPKQIRSIAQAIEGLADSAGDENIGKGLRSLGDDVRKVARSREFDRLGDTLQEVRRGFRVTRNEARVDMEDVRFRVRVNTELIERDLGRNTEAGRRAMEENFRQAVKSIRKAMRDGTIATQRGSREIRRLMRESLELYGFTEDQARIAMRGRKNNGQLNFGDDVTDDPRTSRQFAVGGWVGNAWERGRDKVKAVLGKGEAVLNHYQQRIVNGALRAVGLKRGLHDVFGMTRGRKHWMAEGGLAGEDVVHAAGGLAPVASSFQDRMARLGFHPTSGYRPGDPRQHGQGMALDYGDSINDLGRLWSLLFPMRGQFNQLLGPAGLYNGLTRFSNSALQAQHMDHIHVGFAGRVAGIIGQIVRAIRAPRVLGGGAVGAMAQGALNMQAAAANAFVQNAIGSVSYTGGDHGPGQPAGGYSKGELIALARRAGMRDPNTMAAIALAESSGDPGANGPPDGRGLWQIEWPIWRETMLRAGLSDAYDPWQNAQMAKIVQDNQGLSAWVVYNTGAYRQYLDEGGWVRADEGMLDEAYAADPGWTDVDRRGRHVTDRPDPYGLRMLRNRAGDRVGSYDTLLGEVEQLQNRYERRDRLYGLSEEELLNEDGSLNQEAIGKRSRELGELLKIREKILAKLREARALARRIADNYRTIAKRLRKSLEHAKRKERGGIKKQISTALSRAAGWDTTARDLKWDVEDARLDVLEIRGEKAAVEGTAADVQAPLGDGGDGGDGGVDALISDLERGELAELRERVKFMETLGGPGDIGSGFLTVRDALTLTPPPRTAGADAAPVPAGAPAGIGAGDQGAGGGTFVQNNYMLQPDDPKVLRGVASAAVGGFSRQPFRASTRESHSV